MDTLGASLRQGTRLLALLGIFAAAGLEHLVLGGWRWNRARRARWLQRWSARLLNRIGFEVERAGAPPERGFIAPNHLSYMDIIVLASLAPQVFLSKSEVQWWPLVGSYTRMAGTLFIDRERRRDVATKEGVFSEVIEAGLCLTFFLEGTSTNGEQVLPFRSSLLEPLVRNRWPVTPAYLRYDCEGADVREQVCWWGDMGFVGHVFGLLRVKRTQVTVAFGETRFPEEDRKALAERLYRDVLALAREAPVLV